MKNYSLWFLVCAGLMSLMVTFGGCEVKAKIAINGEQDSDEYSQYYSHGDDIFFYKGTFVVKETFGSVMNRKGNVDTSLRSYRVLGTDVEFQTKVVGTELTHDELLTLKRQGFRIIIK